MRSSLIISLLAACGLAGVWWSGGVGRTSSNVAALVGDDPVTLDQFRSEYSSYLLQTGLEDDVRLRHSFLNRMIDMRILSLWGRDSLSLDAEPSFRLELDRATRKLLIDGYLREVVYDTLTITDQDLEEMFVRVNTQLKASHLFARTLEEAQELKRRLDKGETFEDLARVVFADPELAGNGGSVGYFGFDEMDPHFEDAAYSMRIGEVSEPVQTTTGYSIIRLDDRVVRPLLTEYEFSTRRERIRKYVAYRKQLAARQELRTRILAHEHPRFDKVALEYLIQSGFGNPSDRWTEDEMEGLSRTAVTMSDGSLTVGQIVDEARFLSDKQRHAVVDRESAQEVVAGLIVRLDILKRARQAGIDDRADITDALGSERRKLLYESAWSQVGRNTRVTHEAIRSYYDSHADNFVVPDRVRLREIVVDDNERAHSIMEVLTPSNFGAVAAVSSMRPGAEETGGDLGFVTRDQLGVLADEVFAASPGAMLGPLEARGRYAIFLVGERLAARPSTFDEASGEIEATLRHDVVREAVEERISKVRSHYEIRRHLDRVESFDLRTRVST